MILLVTNRQDLTTDYVVRELDRRGLTYIRLNTEALGEATITLRPDRPEDDALAVEGQSFMLSDIKAAYFRRPEAPSVPESVGDDAVRAYCNAEWTAVLKFLIGRMEGIWFNDPNMINRAEDKPRQLRVASMLGFKIPNTVVTNNPNVAREFVEKQPSIAKPLRHALLEDNDLGSVMFTTRIDAAALSPDESVAAAPIIFQNEINKAVDLRVSVIDQSIFAVAIHSQMQDETSVDWRRGVRPDLLHEVVALPATVAAKCIEITKIMGLRFGAIDLVLDQAGDYWFLEINPNGQWAWIENRTGLPIASAIVDALAEMDGENV